MRSNVKKTTSEFVEDAKSVHGEMYDYSKTEYVNAKTKVYIICPEHGEFWQTPTHHLSGYGCPKCRYIKSANKNRKSIKDFIVESRKVHNNKYDYSKTEYVRRDKKVCIICPEHGEFWQLPGNHLKGCGCPSCSGNKKGTLDSFIKRAREIHGDKYDYSRVKYVNADTKVCIVCPEHGEFWQRPTCHIGKHQGCPICDESHLEGDIRQLLIENKIEYVQEYTDSWLGRQSLDFYLPLFNVAIECQGEGHFTPVRFNGISWDKAKKNFDKTLEMDRNKMKKCIENGTRILYYSDLKIKYPYKVITDKNKLLNLIKK